MASFFNLVLDTTAPSGVSVQINGNAEYATSKTVTLTINCSDLEKTGYQIKIWGIEGAEAEMDASWEEYVDSKEVNLTSGDGQKTVYVKVRDSVWNESSAAQDSIILNTSVPTVTITGPDVARISKVSGKNVSSFTFMADMKIIAWKVMVVESSASLENTGTNKQIPTDGGSTNMTGDTETEANSAISCTIYGADLAAASSGDGTKVVKVFVQNEAGTWSVA